MRNVEIKASITHIVDEIKRSVALPFFSCHWQNITFAFGIDKFLLALLTTNLHCVWTLNAPMKVSIFGVKFESIFNIWMRTAEGIMQKQLPCNKINWFFIRLFNDIAECCAKQLTTVFIVICVFFFLPVLFTKEYTPIIPNANRFFRSLSFSPPLLFLFMQ